MIYKWRFIAGTIICIWINAQPPMFDCREVNYFSYQSQLLADLFKT